MKPNINIIGFNPRQYEFKTGNFKAGKQGNQRSGKSLEYRKYFNTSKVSVDKSALDLWHYCDWIGKPPQDLINEYIAVKAIIKCKCSVYSFVGILSGISTLNVVPLSTMLSTEIVP